MEFDKENFIEFCKENRIILLVDAKETKEGFKGVVVSPDWLIRNSGYFLQVKK